MSLVKGKPQIRPLSDTSAACPEHCLLDGRTPHREGGLHFFPHKQPVCPVGCHEKWEVTRGSRGSLGSILGFRTHHLEKLRTTQWVCLPFFSRDHANLLGTVPALAHVLPWWSLLIQSGSHRNFESKSKSATVVERQNVCFSDQGK